MTMRSELKHVLADYFRVNTHIESEATRLRYHSSINNFGRWLGRPPHLCDLTTEFVGHFIEARISSGTVSLDTVRSDLARLKPLARWLFEEGIIDKPLRLRSPRCLKRNPKALTRSQLRKLWQTADIWPGKVWGVPARIYWPAFLDLGWYTGQRIGAMMQLNRKNIEIREGWFGRVNGASLLFTAQTVKGHKADQAKWIVRDGALSLMRLLEATDSSTPFNPKGMDNTGYIYAKWQRLVDAAGVPWAKPHTLRKSHATHLKIAGGDARISLNHTSDTTTNVHYIDASLVEKRPPASLLFNPSGMFGRKGGGT